MSHQLFAKNTTELIAKEISPRRALRPQRLLRCLYVSPYTPWSQCVSYKRAAQDSCSETRRHVPVLDYANPGLTWDGLSSQLDRQYIVIRSSSKSIEQHIITWF